MSESMRLQKAKDEKSDSMDIPKKNDDLEDVEKAKDIDHIKFTHK